MTSLNETSYRATPRSYIPPIGESADYPRPSFSEPQYSGFDGLDYFETAASNYQPAEHVPCVLHLNRDLPPGRSRSNVKNPVTKNSNFENAFLPSVPPFHSMGTIASLSNFALLSGAAPDGGGGFHLLPRTKLHRDSLSDNEVGSSSSSVGDITRDCSNDSLQRNRQRIGLEPGYRPPYYTPSRSATEVGATDLDNQGVSSEYYVPR